MGFGDLEFGWHDENFDLYDVELYLSFELEELHDDGDWGLRIFSPDFIVYTDETQNFADTDEKKNKEITEYENPKAVKYSKPRRRLRAKAKYSEDTYNHIFLGIPEDKQLKSERDESRIEYFHFELCETHMDVLKRIIKSGAFRYSEDVGPFATFYAPSSVFDNMEKWLSKPNIQIHVSINRKGWHWSDFVGEERHIYLDTENQERAEFAEITISNKLAKFEHAVSEADVKQEIDVDRLMEMKKGLPPSPRDARITGLGIASLAIYLAAAFCGWQIGGWWGVGLIACLYVSGTLDDFVIEEHRQELWQWNGRLARTLAEKTDVLDDVIPKRKNNNGDDSL